MSVAENTFLLELTIRHGSVQRFPFETKSKALAALRAITPKMGERYNSDDKRVHRIKAGDGEASIVMADVSSARVIDYAEYHRLTAYEDARAIALATNINEPFAAALGKALAEMLKPRATGDFA